jgi:hypothetical protein
MAVFTWLLRPGQVSYFEHVVNDFVGEVGGFYVIGIGANSFPEVIDFRQLRLIRQIIQAANAFLDGPSSENTQFSVVFPAHGRSPNTSKQVAASR